MMHSAIFNVCCCNILKAGSNPFYSGLCLFSGLEGTFFTFLSLSSVRLCWNTFPCPRIVHFYNVFMQLIIRYCTNYLLPLTCLWKGCKWDICSTRKSLRRGWRGAIHCKIPPTLKLFPSLTDLLMNSWFIVRCSGHISFLCFTEKWSFLSGRG